MNEFLLFIIHSVIVKRYQSLYIISSSTFVIVMSIIFDTAVVFIQFSDEIQKYSRLIILFKCWEWKNIQSFHFYLIDSFGILQIPDTKIAILHQQYKTIQNNTINRFVSFSCSSSCKGKQRQPFYWKILLLIVDISFADEWMMIKFINDILHNIDSSTFDNINMNMVKQILPFNSTIFRISSHSTMH